MLMGNCQFKYLQEIEDKVIESSKLHFFYLLKQIHLLDYEIWEQGRAILGDSNLSV